MPVCRHITGDTSQDYYSNNTYIKDMSTIEDTAAQTKSERIEEMRDAAHKWYAQDEADQSIEDQEDLRDIDEILDML